MSEQVICHGRTQKAIGPDQMTKSYRNNMPVQGIIGKLTPVIGTGPSTPLPTIHQSKHNSSGPCLLENNNSFS